MSNSMKPEEQVRKLIDGLLEQAGWGIQNVDSSNIYAAKGVALLDRTLNNHELITDEGKAVLDVINSYAKSWTLLLQYDEQQLALPKKKKETEQQLDYPQFVKAITALK